MKILMNSKKLLISYKMKTKNFRILLMINYY